MPNVGILRHLLSDDQIRTCSYMVWWITPCSCMFWFGHDWHRRIKSGVNILVSVMVLTFWIGIIFFVGTWPDCLSYYENAHLFEDNWDFSSLLGILLILVCSEISLFSKIAHYQQRLFTLSVNQYLCILATGLPTLRNGFPYYLPEIA